MEIDRAGLEVLSADECLRLLASSQWGRVAISIGALPAILPVRFALDEQQILFRAGPKTALASGTCGEVVAFQVDGTDDDMTHWSVLVTGVARHLSGSEADRAAGTGLPSWSADASDHLVAIVPEVVSGRRSPAVPNLA
jgi:nitroimidazol reductase NimA-like FMN-containing flavoprotein (pyridoxamine 5'-phosphate oxidase superfamily)